MVALRRQPAPLGGPLSASGAGCQVEQRHLQVPPKLPLIPEASAFLAQHDLFLLRGGLIQEPTWLGGEEGAPALVCPALGLYVHDAG